MLLIIVVFGKLNIRLIPQSLNRGKAVPGGVCGFWGALVDQDGVKEILIWPEFQRLTMWQRISIYKWKSLL